MDMGTDLLFHCSQCDILWIFPWTWHRKEFQALFPTKNSHHSPALQHEDVQGPKRHKTPRNQKPALKKNYELLKQVHLLAPKRKFISLGKATQVSKDMKIIYDFLPLSKKWFMVSSSSHLQLIVGMGRQLIFTGINGIRRGIVLDPSLGNLMGFTVT